MSSALAADEFTAMVSAYNQGLFAQQSSGVREINSVFSLLNTKPYKIAAPDRPVLRVDAALSGQGYECKVTTLSPSDRQIDIFYGEIAALMPHINSLRRRCPTQNRNHLAVVTWIEVGPVAILLGSDLEETPNEHTGWSVIVDSNTRPCGKAVIFKIPHHGSNNGHSLEVWKKMLRKNAISALTPYSPSRLPRNTDVDRLVALTNRGYSTAKSRVAKADIHQPIVSRTLKEMGVTLTNAEPKTGMVRVRNGGSKAFTRWNVELLRGACPLGDVNSA